MKQTLVLALSFLLPLLAFFTNLPLTFSDGVEQVVDITGKPIFPGLPYFILPAGIYGPPRAGLKLGQTGNSKCPLTVFQDLGSFRGFPARLTIPGVSHGIIFTGTTQVEIEFVDKPLCAESSKWLVFMDETIKKACVRIGGAEGHPGQQTLDGNFHIEKCKIGYKLVFCKSGSSTCLDIGRFDAQKGEDGRRLILTEHEAYDLVFVDASELDSVR